jgi:hypothetical protein
MPCAGLALALVGLSPPSAHGASECNPLLPVERATVAAVIFDGVALNGPRDSRGVLRSPVRFRVRRVSKGKVRVGRTLSVRIDPQNDDRVNPRPGELWHVLAARTRRRRLVTWTCMEPRQIRYPDQSVVLKLAGRRIRLPRSSWNGKPVRRLPLVDAGAAAAGTLTFKRPVRKPLELRIGAGPPFHAERLTRRRWRFGTVDQSEPFTYPMVIPTGEAIFGVRIRVR